MQKARMPRFAAIMIATAMVQLAAPARADEPRRFPAGQPRPLSSRPTSQTLANDILAPRSEVRRANHDSTLGDVATNRLVPRSRGAKTLELPDRSAATADNDSAAALPGMGTVFACLCLVLGLFFLVAWLVRKTAPRAAATLPAEVAQPLGRILLAPRHHAHLIRIGNKLLLVSISQAGAETLTEITDPLEVDRLAGICQQSDQHSSSNAFRQVFEQFASQKTPRSFLGTEGSPSRDLPDVHAATRERTHG